MTSGVGILRMQFGGRSRSTGIPVLLRPPRVSLLL
jgi:hypothetical protein